ncbi:polymer-forming cytoskeletal protein, partial [Corallococcus coralloides]|nr:polymer-forming cytoskeletal protein [Corallococcus coralloides]
PPPPARTQPASAPATVVARPSAKPLPPPPPPAATRAPEPPRPAATEQASSAGAPVPRVMGAGAKKKVVVKKSR